MLVLAVQPDSAALAGVRRAVRRWAAGNGFDEFALTLLATELVTNARQAAGPDGSVELIVARWGSVVEIRVSDDGPGFGPLPDGGPGSSLPSVSDRGGRGLYLVRQLSTDVEVNRIDGRTVVRALVDGGSGQRDGAASSAGGLVEGTVRDQRAPSDGPLP